MESKLPNQAVIFAGGKGERLKPLTNTVPKPMAPINGKPFLDYLLMSLINAGITEVLLLVGYKGDQIIKRYRDIKGVDIRFSVGSVEDNTGRRLIQAEPLLADSFLLLYGDTYWPINIDQYLMALSTINAPIYMTVFANEFGTGEYGYDNNVLVSSEGYVKIYDQSRKTGNLNGLDIGYFMVRKECLDFSIKDNIDFGRDILSNLVVKNPVGSVVTNDQYFYLTDLNTLDHFANVATRNNFESLTNQYLKLT